MSNRVGKFKSFVEPYIRSDQSPDARAASQALYGTLFAQWREAVAKARPKAQIDTFLTQPDRAVLAANGSIADANLKAGLVDKLGDKLAFGKRVAEIAGAEANKPRARFRTISYASWGARQPAADQGRCDRRADHRGNTSTARPGPARRGRDGVQGAARRPGQEESEGAGRTRRTRRWARCWPPSRSARRSWRPSGRSCPSSSRWAAGGVGRLLGLDPGPT